MIECLICENKVANENTITFKNSDICNHCQENLAILWQAKQKKKSVNAHGAYDKESQDKVIAIKLTELAYVRGNKIMDSRNNKLDATPIDNEYYLAMAFESYANMLAKVRDFKLVNFGYDLH